MVYVTGDTHTSESFSKLYFEEGQKLTKDDFVIILGDIELIWSDSDGSDWINKLTTFLSKPFFLMETMTIMRNFQN